MGLGSTVVDGVIWDVSWLFGGQRGCCGNASRRLWVKELQLFMSLEAMFCKIADAFVL